MLPLTFSKSSHATYKILCLGAHSDDIEIGCGGAILKLLRTRHDLEFYWVVFSSGAGRDREAYRSADLFLKGAAKKTVVVKNFRGSFFPFIGGEIKDFFEVLKEELAPDLIFTHTSHDRHQDHRTINEFTWNTWRNHFILEYEVPKYDGDLGSPNLFIPFDRKIRDRKIKHLMECFKTQRDKQWFTPDTFQALMRLRGIESHAPGRFAEAFYCRKAVLRP